MAEIAGEHLKKGSQVYVEGALRTRKWQDQNGVDRWTTEIVASEMQMVGSRGLGGDSGRGPGNMYPAQQQQAPQQVQQPAPPAQGMDDLDDSIPF